MSQGKIEEAIQAFDAALATAPDHFESSHNKGVALSALERYEEALKCFEAATEKMPTFYAAQAGKSESLAHLDRFEESVKAADAAIAIDQNNYVGYNDKGFAHLRLGQIKEAVASYEKAVSLGDDSAETMRLLGVTLSQGALVEEGKGNFKEALRMMDRSLEFQQSAPAYHNRAIVLVRMDNVAGAIASLLEAVKCDPEHFESYALLGALCSQSGENEKAQKYLETALQLKPGATGARYNLGAVKIKLGDAQGARAEWEKILEVEPGEPNATEALRILNEAVRKVTAQAAAEAADEKEQEEEEGEATTVVAAAVSREKPLAESTANESSKTEAVATTTSEAAMETAIAATAAEEIVKFEIANSLANNANAAESVPPASQTATTEAKRRESIQKQTVSSTVSKKPPVSAAVASKSPTNDIQRSFVRDLSSAPPPPKSSTKASEQKRNSIVAAAHLDLDKHTDVKRRGSVSAPPSFVEIRTFTDYTKTKYTIKEIQNGTAKGLDPAKKEQYLSDEEFVSVFKITRAEFDSLPLWRMQLLKKNAKLF